MIEAKSLKTEHLINPLGITFNHPPRLSWLPIGANQQSAWRVQVKRNNADTVFDSGKAISANTYCVPDMTFTNRDRIEWDGIDSQGNVAGSFNHYSYGSIVGWLFDRVCGIRVENGTITIHPYPNPVLGYAEAWYLSPLGEIRSGWKYRDGGITYTITVPCNQSATVILVDGSRHKAGPGTVHYTHVI